MTRVPKPRKMLASTSASRICRRPLRGVETSAESPVVAPSDLEQRLEQNQRTIEEDLRGVVERSLGVLQGQHG